MRRALPALIVVLAVACSSGDDDAAAPTSAPGATADSSSTVADTEPGRPSVVTIDESTPLGSSDLGQSTGPLGSTRLDIETDEGSMQIGGGEIPSSAAGFPLPAGFELQLSSETDDATGFSGVVASSVDEVAGFFRQELPVAGFDIVDDQAPTPAVVLIRFSSDDDDGEVAISGAPGGAGTTVVVTLSR
ncbi:MAG: hypothetical protein MUE78_09330 [Ilumatobacteraceae bacterium]|nr:hypothetical protein [Ilumatobacteraceae bacterium]